MKKCYIPVLDPSVRTLRDWIIVALLKGQRAMNARELKRSINKAYPCGYNNVYRTAERLCNEGVIRKVGPKYSQQGYEINPNWATQIQTLAGQITLAEAIKKKSPLAQILRNLDNPVEFSTLRKFPCLYDLESWIMEFAAYEKVSMYSQSKHFWWHIIYPQENREMVKKVLAKSNNEIVGVAGTDTPIERLCISWSKPLGQKVAINTNLAEAPHYFVVGEYLLHCHYPITVLSKMTELFNSVRRIQDLPSAWEITPLLEERKEATLLIAKSTELSDIIKKHITKSYIEAYSLST
jgi:hypothetical protein